MIQLMLRSFRFYRRMHAGVFIGAMLAAATLTGALLVGDSVDYSLRESATMRLGGVNFAAHTRGNFVNEELTLALTEELNTPVAAILHLPGMAIYQDGATGESIQINQVQFLGIDELFWSFAENASLSIGRNETAINEKLAKALGVKEGDEISMRVINPSLMAGDAPLSGQSEDDTQRRRYRVKAIVSDAKLGRFDLSPSQIAPYNAFVNRDFLQEQIELPGRVNLMLAGAGPTSADIDVAIKKVWQPEHLGMTFRAHDSGVVQLETDRIFIDSETERAAMTEPNSFGTLTYLVNEIAKDDRKTPYSFVSAGSVPDDMQDDEIVINQWVADELHAAIGDQITLDYYELSPSNEFLERSRDFRVHSIRSMESLIGEKELMPTFPGLSDVESCTEWDVGMPMDDALLEDEANEAYWDAYRQTPKALVTLHAGQEMWANRFGGLTSVRVPGEEHTVAEFRNAVRNEMDPGKAGLVFIAVREEADRAVNQAMDFGGLFLGMSFFLIVAALMLTGLLFVFGVQQRSSEFGVLLALGFRPSQIRTLLFGEGLLVALIASIVGALMGTFYTRALVYGLSQYWQGAVAGAAIKYHGETSTLFVGAIIGVVSALVAMMMATRRQLKHSARELLMLDFAQERQSLRDGQHKKWALRLPVAGVLIAVAVIIYAEAAQIMDIAYAFFGAGSILLVSCLGLCRYALISLQSRQHRGDLSLRQLAVQNLARRRGRSLTVIGLLGCGCFLVFSVSAMQEDLSAHSYVRSSGTGGFALVADATLPILENPVDALSLPDTSGVSIKVRDGDDASCLNLNRAQTPRLLGVHVEDFISRGAFSPEKDEGELWGLLDMELEDGVIPALVGDANTAMWTLQKKAGVKNGDVLLYLNEAGEEIKVKLVGTLPMRLSVFQGTILISDSSFTRIFPSEDGYRMFLMDTASGTEKVLTEQLHKKYDRNGLDVVTTSDRLLEFYSVETTYLAMFLVLGGIGLALGSIGMAIVVLRNLFEQSAEIAILRALGFTQEKIYRIVGMEYGFLLIAGLSVGTIAALVSVIPAVFASTTSVNFGVQVGIFILVTVTAAACTLCAVIIGIRRNDVGALRHE